MSSFPFPWGCLEQVGAGGRCSWRNYFPPPPHMHSTWTLGERRSLSRSPPGIHLDWTMSRNYLTKHERVKIKTSKHSRSGRGKVLCLFVFVSLGDLSEPKGFESPKRGIVLKSGCVSHQRKPLINTG